MRKLYLATTDNVVLGADETSGLHIRMHIDSTYTIIPVRGPRKTAYPDIAVMNEFAVYVFSVS